MSLSKILLCTVKHVFATLGKMILLSFGRLRPGANPGPAAPTTRRMPRNQIPQCLSVSGRYVHIMAHICITATLDEDLLGRARSARPTLSDSELIAAALKALARRVSTVRIHTAHSTFEENPIESFGEWGDLASFQAARIDTFRAARAA